MSSSSSKVRTAKAVAAASVLLATSAVVAGGSAEAYVVSGGGCRFDPSNDNDGLGIGFTSTNFNQGMRDATEDGAARWNNSGGPATFTIVSYGSSTRDVRVVFSNLGASGAAASITRWCSSSANHYSQDPRFNWNLDFKYPSSGNGHSLFRQRSVTAIHELGHGYGLSHNQGSGCDTSSRGLMFAPSRDKLESCGWINPTSDDTKGAADAHDG